MRNIIANILIFGGIALGLYVGVYLCFFGGIIGIIDFIKDPSGTPSIYVAFSIIKILSAVIVTNLVSIVAIIPGINLYRNKK